VDETTVTPPDPPPPARSGLASRVRRAWYWLLALARLDDAPTAAGYAEARAAAAGAMERAYRLQIENAALRAERDAYKAALDQMALVIARDRERVLAETAMAAADREKNINTAAGIRRSRAED